MGLLDSISQGVGIVSDLFNAGEQIESQSYMRDMQKKSWEREDNAVQRRVKDLEAAGLSPTLAAGSSAASSGPINAGVPQFEGANAMRAVEYGQARRQNAVTEANLDLVRTQTDAADANSFLSRMLRDELIRRSSEGDDKGATYSVLSSMIDKMIAEGGMAKTTADVAAYNAALAASQGMPATNESLGLIAQGKALDNVLKNPSTAAGPLAGLVKAFGFLLGGMK